MSVRDQESSIKSALSISRDTFEPFIQQTIANIDKLFA